jgi:hypothetical protein
MNALGKLRITFSSRAEALNTPDAGRLDDAEKRAFAPEFRDPRNSVSCAAVSAAARFTYFADRVAPTARVRCVQRLARDCRECRRFRHLGFGIWH